MSIDYLRYVAELSLGADDCTDRATGNVGVLPALRAQLHL